MKIVVLDGYAGNPGDLSWEGLEALGECHIYDRTGEEDVISRIKDAEVVMTNKVVLDSTIIAAAPKLKYIGIIATGVNIVDLDAAKRRGIVVTNVPAYSTDSVAQNVFAHLLNITNRVYHYARKVREGYWDHAKDFAFTTTPMLELAGKTMGIVGLGNIGMAVARIAMAFNMKVIALTSKKQEELPEGITSVDIDTLFTTSDVVTLHCPLMPETQGLVNEKRLRAMKPQAVLINTARGALINESHLADCLKKGGLLGAGLDVMTTEAPLADNALLKLRNCYITPHLGWMSKEARIRLMDAIVANLKGWIDGKPVNLV